MEETKKANKPRAPKKAKAAKANAAAETPIEQAAEQQPQPKKTAKKPAKKPANKAAKAAKKEAVVAPQEVVAETPVAANEAPVEAVIATAAKEEKPAKKAPNKAKKAGKKEEVVAPQETHVEAPVAAQEAPAAAQEAPAAAVETPAQAEQATPKKAKKKPAKKAAKKTEAEPIQTANETPVETAQEAPVAAQEAPVETVQEVPAVAETPAQETAKKPAKKAPKKAKKDEEKQEAVPVQTMTRAEKKDAIMAIVRGILSAPCKWAELLEAAAKEYKEKYPSKENERDSDVKGRIGSVIDLMKKEGEVIVEGGVARWVDKSATAVQENGENAPLQAPMAGTNEAETPVEAPVQTAEETPAATEETQESTAVAVVDAPAPAPVYDMSSLFDRKKPVKKETKKPVKADVEAIVFQREEETAQTAAQPQEVQTPATPAQPPVAEEKTERKIEKTEKPVRTPRRADVPKRVVRGGGADRRDPLKESFLRKLRSLGGDYFEYYSVYLLERYSRRNGRRLEGMRISGGEHDGGIDGEIELTDRLGFRETIYIQAKNWAPTDEKWTIGETLLQQFIGAVAYRKAVEGKQHCRGIYITTSCFSTGAKAMLEKMSDQFVGYDGDDLFETAKECEFGLIKGANGEWKIDEELLSGERALFYML